MARTSKTNRMNMKVQMISVCLLSIFFQTCSTFRLPTLIKHDRGIIMKRSFVQAPQLQEKNMHIRGGEVIVSSQLVPILGTLLTNAMFAAGIPTIQSLREHKSLGSLNVIPFAMLFGNCLSWTSYSLYVSNPYIFMSSAPGILFGLYLFSTGIQYGSPLQRKQLEILIYFSTTLVLISSFLISMILKTSEQCEQLSLFLGTFYSMMYYIAPLTSIKEVIQTKSSDSICAPMCLMGFINSMLWFIYGMSLKKPSLAIPNGIAAFLSLLQLFIVFIYRNGSNNPIELADFYIENNNKMRQF